MKDISIPIRATVSICQGELVEALCDSVDYDGIVQLIRAIDEHCSDWDFSRLIIELGEELASVLRSEEGDDK